MAGDRFAAVGAVADDLDTTRARDGLAQAVQHLDRQFGAGPMRGGRSRSGGLRFAPVARLPLALLLAPVQTPIDGYGHRTLHQGNVNDDAQHHPTMAEAQGVGHESQRVMMDVGAPNVFARLPRNRVIYGGHDRPLGRKREHEVQQGVSQAIRIPNRTAEKIEELLKEE